MPSPAEVVGLQAALLELARRTNISVAALLASGAATAEIANSYPELLAPFLAAAGAIAAQWYHELSPAAPFAAEVPAELASTEALNKSVWWASTQPDTEQSLALSTERRVLDASRATVKYNADREGVRYAWYASANACGFCRMLATRPANYTSRAVIKTDQGPALRVVGRYGRPRGTRKIGEKYHDGCRCLPVPIRAGDSWQPPDYYAQFEDDYNAAAQSESGTQGVINHMRRADYGRNKDAINADRRQAYAERKAAQETSPTPGV